MSEPEPAHPGFCVLRQGVVMNRDKPQNGCVHPGTLSVPRGPFFSFRLSTQELGSKTEMRFRKGQDPFL